MTQSPPRKPGRIRLDLLNDARARKNLRRVGIGPPRPGDQKLTPNQMMVEALKDPKRAMRELVRLVCRNSFYEFVKRAWPYVCQGTPMVEGQVMRVLCDHLQAVTEGKIERLLVNVPPGCSKSLLVNVLWPAWEWGPRGYTHHRFIGASYELGLSIIAMTLARDLILSPWFQDHWPIDLKGDQNEKSFWANTLGGWRKASSVGGALTGYRGHRIIIDDPHDVKRAESDVDREIALRWWTQTVPTRFCDPKRPVYVVIMQRLHVQDVSGHILEKTPDGWAKLILPMEYEPGRRCSVPQTGFEDWRTTPGELLWPERFDRKAVDELKRDLSSKGGSYAVAGQLQQRPIPMEGGLFKGAPQLADESPKEGIVARGWDLAATEGGGDWTVGVRARLAQGKVWVEDVRYVRGSPLQVRSLLKGAATDDGTKVSISVPQDPGQAGVHQKADLANLLGGYHVHFSVESGDKVVRALPISAQWEAGNVVVLRRPWTDWFLQKIALFPGDGLDAGDAFSRAYARLLQLAASVPQLGRRGGLLIED